ncbi:UNVERIFIED_CONTAM: transmembrane protein, putative [Hammondia hammondi]|eukprot:XP_008886386.1 transmembrane protein, putative [Hammondia hammondi]
MTRFVRRKFLPLLLVLWILTAVVPPVRKRATGEPGRHFWNFVFTRAAESTEEQGQQPHLSTLLPRPTAERTSLEETEPTRKRSAERGNLRATDNLIGLAAEGQEADAQFFFKDQAKKVGPFRSRSAEALGGEDSVGAGSLLGVPHTDQRSGAMSSQPLPADKEQNGELPADSESVEDAFDMGSFDSKERAKPPEVNVSQVWVQDSPQDYIAEGSSGSKLDTSHLRAITESLEGLKGWLLRRINELDTEILAQQQIRNSTQQWAADLQQLIGIHPCARLWETEFA